MRKILRNVFIFSLLCAVFTLSTPSVLALTADEIQAKIKDLQAQIESLMAQLKVAQGTEQVWCHNFNTNLRYGDNSETAGEEVLNLQKALNKQGFYQITKQEDGYFGDFTASAVVEFQEKYADEILSPFGLKRGTGYVGKTTRAKLNKLYGCKQIGTIPSFCAQVITPAQNLATGECKNFPTLCDVPSTWQKVSSCSIITPTTTPVMCIQEGESVLRQGSQSCCSGLSQISRTVMSGNMCGIPVPESFDICSYCGNGICGKGENICNCPSDCKTEKNLPPVIDGLTAPTQLKVNEQGTWKVEAHDPENKPLSYKVVWGDEFLPLTKAMTSGANQVTQTTSFTHSYNTAGTYFVIFTVTDDHQQTAKTSTTVEVVEVALSCTDSDGGKDYYTKGYINYSGLVNATVDCCATTEYNPNCVASSNYLAERYCTSYGYDTEIYRCPFGCSDGACKEAPTTNIPPKIVGIPSVPVGIQAGQPVSFSWSATDADNDNLAWSMGWGDGTGESQPCPSYEKNWSISSSHAWTQAGVYTAQASVSDCKGGSDTHSLRVTIDSTSTPISTPALNVSVDPSSPTSTVLAPGQTNVTFAKIKLTADKDAVNNLNNIQIGSDSLSASSYLTNIKIYDGSTQLGHTAAELAFNGSYYYVWIPVSNVSIPAYSSKILTIIADVKPVSVAGEVRLGIAGLNFDTPGTWVPGVLPAYGFLMNIIVIQ